MLNKILNVTLKALKITVNLEYFSETKRHTVKTE